MGAVSVVARRIAIAIENGEGEGVGDQTYEAIQSIVEDALASAEERGRAKEREDAFQRELKALITRAEKLGDFAARM